MSFPAYPTYKKSDVEWLGEVPEHWILTPLKHLALLNPRKSGYDGDTEQLCSFVPMEKLKTGVVQLDEERPIVEVIGGYTYFEDGDVLQAKVTPCFENKNIAIAKGLTNGIGFGSSEINVLRPCKGVNAEYLYYRVQEDSYMDFCTSSMIGAGGLKRVPTDVINNFKVATPEVFEQTQIARFLDHETARIDALIEEQQRLIELLKEKRQAVISHAVIKGLDPTVPMKDSGVEWLGEVPAHWGVSKFGFLKTVLTDYTANGSFADLKSNVTYLDSPNFARLVRLTDLRKNLENPDGVWIDEDAYKYLAKSALFGGEFLLANVGAYAGLFYQMPYGAGPASLAPNMFMAKFDEKKILPSFVSFAAIGKSAHDQLRLLATASSAQPKLNKDDFKSVIVALPTLQEQAQIVAFLDTQLATFDALVAEAESGVSLLQERRSALISAAVTGKIDVRGWQPTASIQAPEPAVAEAH